MKTQLLFPMTAYVLYIWCLAIFMFLTRVRTVKSGETHVKYFKSFVGTPPPDRVVLIGRHYDNQFQLPLLFLVTCTLHIVLGRADVTTLSMAWAFVVSRGLHSWVHLGSNRILKRAATFALGWALILLLWAQLVYFAL